jgi:threonine/homoserine/homoserine lactone efflux protein
MLVILLTIAAMWNITDGWFSLSLYLKDKNQTWYKDHYIRVIRILIGVLLIYLAFTNV